MTMLAAAVLTRQPDDAGSAPAATPYRERVRNPAGTGGAPIGYWRLAETGGATAVDAQELQDGIYHGSIEYLVPGITDGSERNGAIAGDGRSAWLEIPHVARLALAEYTLSFCFQADGLPPRGQNVVLLSKDTLPSPEGGLSIELITSATTGETRLRMYTARAGSAAWLGGTAGKTEGLGAEILVEVAHHVALVLNGDGVRLYLDGAEIGADQAQKTGWTDNDRRISVLTWDGSDAWYDGIVDELAIYDHGLTVAEIADLARARTAPNPAIHAEPGVQIFDSAYATEWRFAVDVAAPGKDRRVYIALAWNSENIGSEPESFTLDGVAGRLVTPSAAQQWNRAAAIEWLDAELPAHAGACTVTIRWPAGDPALGRAFPLSYIGHEQVAAEAQSSSAAGATAIEATVTCPKSGVPIVGVLSLGAANRPSPGSGQTVLHSAADTAQANLWAFDRSLPDAGDATGGWTFPRTNRAAYHLGVLPTNRAGDLLSGPRPSGEVSLTNAARRPSARPPVDASIWVAPGGTETDPAASTESNPMGSIAAAIRAASQGTVIAVAINPSAEWDYDEVGEVISGKNGTQAKPIKVIGYGARRVRVDHSLKAFRGGSAGSPLSAWTQINASKQIWQSVGNFARHGDPVHGFMDAADDRLRLLTYTNSTAFNNTNVTATDSTPYCGPGLFFSGSKIQIRVQDDPFTDDIYGGPRPQNKNPNQNDMVVFGKGTMYRLANCSWIEFHFIDFLYTDVIFDLNGCHHILWEDGQLEGRNEYINIDKACDNLTWSHINSFYQLPHYLAYSDWKQNSPAGNPTPYNAHSGFRTNGDGITNLKFLDCVFRGGQEPIWTSGNVTGIEVAHCSFLDCRDDPIAMGMDNRDLDFHHNYLHWCTWGIGRTTVGQADEPDRGPWYVHHNIFDIGSYPIRESRGRSGGFTGEPDPGKQFTNTHLIVGHISEGNMSGDPFTYKFYYNTVIYGKDDDGIYGCGLEYQPGWIHPSSRSAAQEIFNNILVARWDWHFFRKFLYGKSVVDGNVYHRPGGSSTTAFHQLEDKNGNRSNFSSLSALQDSSSMTNGLFYNPLDGNSLQVNPQLKGSFPIARGDTTLYWPLNSTVRTGAVNITSQGWPGASTYQAVRGALETENSQIGPRQDTFASF